jgi:hypothetical protein
MKKERTQIFQPNIVLLNNMVLKTYHNSEMSFILKETTFGQRILVVSYPNLE